MANDTKGRILVAALEMFSQNGYAGTNVRELTASLGLVKSSMYKHFRSKEEIWNTLLDELIAYYEARFGSSEHLPPVPDSLEELVTMTMRMANFPSSNFEMSAQEIWRQSISSPDLKICSPQSLQG